MKSSLECNFKLINFACFNGKLKLCKIRYKTEKDCWGSLDGFGVKNKELVRLQTPIINIKRNLSLRHTLMVLGHEMIHYSDWVKRSGMRYTHVMHTERFMAKESVVMKKMSRLYNVPMTPLSLNKYRKDIPEKAERDK